MRAAYITTSNAFNGENQNADYIDNKMLKRDYHRYGLIQHKLQVVCSKERNYRYNLAGV